MGENEGASSMERDGEGGGGRRFLNTRGIGLPAAWNKAGQHQRVSLPHIKVWRCVCGVHPRVSVSRSIRLEMGL